MKAAGLLGLVVATAFYSCGPPPGCGPEVDQVAHVTDGDTVRLEGGERVRYLLMDTPEIHNGPVQCFGPEAAAYNATLVAGRSVSLTYDPAQCRDKYDRLLAYVRVAEGEVNSILVRQGFARVLHIPPAGNDRVAEFLALQAAARRQSLGLWGNCP